MKRVFGKEGASVTRDLRGPKSGSPGGWFRPTADKHMMPPLQGTTSFSEKKSRSTVAPCSGRCEDLG